MMNIINAIPDSMGWAMVGSLFTLDLVIIVKIIGMFFKKRVDNSAE